MSTTLLVTVYVDLATSPEGKSSLITSVLRGFGSALYEPSIASTFSESESGLG
jgi:hypothetical protein